MPDPLLLSFYGDDLTGSTDAMEALTLGGVEWDMWTDGWTVLTRDGSWAAQWEHTLVVTDDGAEILTLPST